MHALPYRQSIVLGAVAIAALCGPIARAADKPKEEDYYRLDPIPIPSEINLEAGGLEWLPDGKLAICTRRGDVFIASGALGETERVRFDLFASGLHEPLGVVQRDGWLYVTQRGEITRIKDEDGDGRGDIFETFNDGWEMSGDYHEYAFGSKFDQQGDQWVVLCLTGSFTSDVKFRGWCLRVKPDGSTVPTCSGIRSPGGIGTNAEGDMFYTDNQGPWNGTCGLKHLKPGGFMGHTDGNRWYSIAADVMGPRPKNPTSGSRMLVEEKRVPELVPTAIMFPYNKMGQSASGIITDMTKGKFGPFAGQMFVGDQTHSTVMRCFLEKVDGIYQGACFPFRQGVVSAARVAVGVRVARSPIRLIG
jgi:hypothetical protein